MTPERRHTVTLTPQQRAWLLNQRRARPDDRARYTHDDLRFVSAVLLCLAPVAGVVVGCIVVLLLAL